ncbi:hypothetical protein IHE44_0011422 [Lamprotornis superbus]|uniref:Ig-like domain-containing protein n=1 Tax=Lamprotornis superbus TaxID=245042 RepID=A0A835NGP5_9PASS|nr:hypothetical protein IHE44_0011422 [Lamprotornis superbus]
MPALFTVEAPQSLCVVERGNNVTMECTFPVNGKLKFRDLSVSWEKKDESKQVYVLHKGEEDFESQHNDFKGRIKLLKENLNLGQSLLQITDVKLRDAGVYRCVVVYGGGDYKTIHLKVKDSADGILQTESRRFAGAALIAAAFIGSGLLFLLCIRKARANKGNRTPVASSSTAKLSKDKDTHDCRDDAFEDRELKYLSEKMFQILTILLLETQFSVVSVEVPQQLYTVEYGSNVTMECRFPVNGSVDLELLTVVWEQKRQGWSKSKEVYTFHNGKALHQSQHPDNIGRASLLHSELKLGRAILQITNVKITDAGSYLCLIDYQGVDYKYIALEVKASSLVPPPSSPLNPGLVGPPSEGFPLADVFWQNENFNLSGPANTTYTLTADGLYNVTSILTLKPNTITEKD